MLRFPLTLPLAVSLCPSGLTVSRSSEWQANGGRVGEEKAELVLTLDSHKEVNQMNGERVIPENVRSAVKLLGVYTAQSFDIWALSGSSKASCRAHVMSTLLGYRVPQSKSGINAMREEFNRIAGVSGECIAAREDNFRAWAVKVSS